MPAHAPLFRFLRDCYRDDHRSGALLDVFAGNVEARLVSAAGFQVLPMAEDESALEPAAFEPAVLRHGRQRKLAQRAWLGRGEKELLVGSFFVAGAVGDGESRRRVCAPLWTWEPFRQDDEDCVERTRASPNLALLRTLLQARRGAVASVDGGADDDSDAAEGESAAEPSELDEELEAEFDTLLRRIPDVPRTREHLEQAAAAVGATSGLGASVDAESLQQLAQTAQGLVWVACEMLILRKRSIDSRGVLTELAQLAQTQELSESLHRLVADEPAASRGKRRTRRIEAPASLSDPQRAVIQNAESEPLSLVIGPPGTGKSFTIAATALDALSRGESVLIVAKTHHAVDVVADKLEAMLGLGEWVVRGGRREYRRELAERLDHWLEGNVPVYGRDKSEARRLEGALERCEERIAALERDLAQRSELEIAWGEQQLDAAAGVERGWLAGLWQAWRNARRAAVLEDSAPYWHLMDAYREAVQQRIGLLSELLRHRVVGRLRRALGKDRQTLTRMRQSVTAFSVRQREEFFADLDVRALLRAAPVWMLRVPEAAQVLPLARALFDLVIFDEATQCDIASALPVMHRAARCQVVGDPRQLRHLSFLGRRHQQRLAEHRGLQDDVARRFDYRDTSFLDLVNQTLGSQDQVAFLDEHFRSVPEIIEFSNRELYASRLRVMQEHPAQRFHRALELRRVGGSRRPAGDNPAEVEALVADVVEHVRRQADEPDELCHSLGVLSPLRAQVESLTAALIDRLSDRDLQRHDLRVATAYGFQGEERDVMFLSLALDGGSHASAMRFVQRPDVFNVAITRARVRQVVYTSLTRSDAPDGLLGRYLDHVETGSAPPAGAGDPDDAFLREVRSRLELEGLRVWPEYPVAGMAVDLVVERDGRCLGIDLVGYPGRFAGSFELERYRLFNRAGLRLMPLPYSAWRRDATLCVEAVTAKL